MKSSETNLSKFLILSMVIITLVAVAYSSDACESNPCQRDCYCRESCQHELGYVCIATSQSAVGKNCQYDAPNVSATFETITINIKNELFSAFETKPDTMTFYVAPTSDSNSTHRLNSHCHAKQSFYEDDIFIIELPLYPDLSCGTTRTYLDSNTMRLFNKLWINTKITNRFIDMPIHVLDFQVDYKLDGFVSTAVQPVKTSATRAMQDEVHLGPEMQLCKVSTCSKKCPDNLSVRYRAIYTVGEKIHVSIDFSDQVHLFKMFGGHVVAVQHVSLSCKHISDHSNSVTLLDSSCVTDVGKTLRFQPPTSVSSDTACFSFLIPQLTSCGASGFYIHTTVQICPAFMAQGKQCGSSSTIVRSCNPTTRRKRLAQAPIYEETGASYSVGPIYIVSVINKTEPAVRVSHKEFAVLGQEGMADGKIQKTPNQNSNVSISKKTPFVLSKYNLTFILFFIFSVGFSSFLYCYFQKNKTKLSEIPVMELH